MSSINPPRKSSEMKLESVIYRIKWKLGRYSWFRTLDLLLLTTSIRVLLRGRKREEKENKNNALSTPTYNYEKI